MQIKTIGRYHYIPITMSKIKKIDRWGGCGEITTVIHCWWECKMEQQP